MNRMALRRERLRAPLGVLVLFACWAAGNAVWAAGAAPLSWPSNPDGTVFKWENGKGPALASDPAGKPIENYFLMPKGLAWLDRNYAMKFQNGAFPLPRGSEHILNQVKKANRLSIEAVITPLFETPYGACNVADKPIISFAASSLDGNFMLTQGAGAFRNNGMLSLFLQTAVPGGEPSVSKVDLCYILEGGKAVKQEKNGKVIGPGQPMHIIVTYEPGLLVCYANGKKVLENRGIQGDFSRWTMHPFVFAGDEPGPVDPRARQRHWEGLLEGVCLYSRVLSPGEAVANYGLYKQKLDARKPVAQLKVQGKLLGKSAIHTAAQITPYRNELAMYEYEVEKVLSGDYKAKKIRVAQWVLMDGVALAQSQTAVGKSCTLQVESFDDHPQFGSERQSDTLPFDGGLTRYVDVGPIDETPVDPVAMKAVAEAQRALTAARKKTPIDPAQIAPNILKLTGGARTKIVWAREVKPDAKLAWSDEFEGEFHIKMFCGYERWALMAFDTLEGKERELIPGPMSCVNPWITYDGARVLFTDMANQTACVIDWDGKNRRVISRDRSFNLVCYLRDAQTGIEWAYVNDADAPETPPGQDTQPDDVKKRVYRIQVDDPSVRELVWVGGYASHLFRVSADGKYAGGELGTWPKQYLLSLADSKLAYRGTGCHPQLAPDNSYRLFYYDGQHQNVILHDGDGSNPRKIRLMDLRPEFYSQTACLVNWSNDARFFTMSAPYQAKGYMDIHLARFNDAFTAVADLAPVTDSPIFNNMPFAWVEPKGLAPAQRPAIQALRRTATELPSREPVKSSAECLRTREAAAADWASPATGMKFKRIAPGSFTAGSTKLQGFTASGPHEVKITHPFYIGTFDVTQEEWEKVMGSNPSDFKGPTLPVESVSWLDAQEFLKKLSEKDKATYRLPTEAEWEYACRAGTTTEYYWKPVFDGAYAWALENSEGRTHEVGTRLPNAWGLYDMSGNVFQWTSDSFVGWPSAPQTDPSNPVDPKKSNRVDPSYRGGAFSSDAEYCSSGARIYVPSGLNYRSRALGFRVVRDVEPGK